MKNKAFDHSKYANWIDPQAVKPYEHNIKIHNEKQIKNIANSIKRFGWQQDTVITADNVCVIGHGRRLAAIMLNCQMPYHVIDKTADELTEKDIRELRIADNQTNAETGFDFAEWETETVDLDFDGFDFEFTDGDWEHEDGKPEQDSDVEVVEDDFNEEETVETVCKLGDVWQLGEHRLICGDSTELICYATRGKHTFNFPKQGHALSTWTINKKNGDTGHPTEKPVEVPAMGVSHSSKENDVVLDLFGGSGSTLIACEQLNRRCYMCELDEHYCDVIISRFEKFTGKKAIKVEDNGK